MVLMEEGPLTGNLAQSDGHAKVEIAGAAALDDDAAHEGDGEGHVGPGGDMEFADIENRRLGR